MSLMDNEILIRYICDFFNTNEHSKSIKPNLLIDYYVSVINYVISTRKIPDENFYTKMNEAKNIQDYIEITSKMIYKNLSEQVVEKGLNPIPFNIYSLFVDNFYCNGLLFSAKKEVKNFIKFPPEFKDLKKLQNNNAIVKAFEFSENNGKFTYFAPCPQTAFLFSCKLSGFWSTMFNKINSNDLMEVKQFLKHEVAKLNLSQEKKTNLFNDIVESFEEYKSSKNIKLTILDRHFAHDWQACKLNGADYNQNFGKLAPYKSFDDAKSNYTSDTTDKQVVLSEIKSLYFPISLYCKGTSQNVEKYAHSVNVTISQKENEMIM